MNLKDKKVLITGASSGIGLAIATTLAKAGAHVAFTYNSNETGAKETLKQIGEHGLMFKVDFAKEDEIDVLFEKLNKEWGSLDILVNNAGVNRPRGLFETKDWKEVFQIDLFSAVKTTGLAVELMENKGKVLNITSIYGFGKACYKGIAPYGAAKAALNHYTEVLAKNLAPKILVNAIAPGYVKTPLWGNKSEQEFKDSGEEQLIERMIEPSEIANMAKAILENDAMTGEIVIVDGGLSLKTI
ncbi:SDR family oxidoreductase [Candidatus Dojkabacteria bacterium]|uniref:SDR family oxidoreductase n=1 Tax=Candidatus Dojkabacteria bacterium TaxID=2099670 RepID=A0A955L9S0_9BACT|nr:SDR family oxidoreductase [Candidatus Dojkabacteria bacterium]